MNPTDFYYDLQKAELLKSAISLMSQKLAETEKRLEEDEEQQERYVFYRHKVALQSVW